MSPTSGTTQTGMSPTGMAQPPGMPRKQPCVPAGVHPGQPAGVVLEAARLAAAPNCPLVCACANPARFPVAGADDGSLVSEPVEPDFMDDDGACFLARLMAGDPAQVPARCAETIGATMIVVGTHGGRRAQLTQKHHRPVLVVPGRRGRRVQGHP